MLSLSIESATGYVAGNVQCRGPRSREPHGAKELRSLLSPGGADGAEELRVSWGSGRRGNDLFDCLSPQDVNLLPMWLIALFGLEGVVRGRCPLPCKGQTPH